MLLILDTPRAAKRVEEDVLTENPVVENNVCK